jgi:hypothetical protein
LGAQGWLIHVMKCLERIGEEPVNPFCTPPQLATGLP